MGGVTAPALEFREVRYAYPGRPETLKGISLSLGRGRKSAILGPNGAGKTTLLLHCNGTLRPSGGAVLVNGRPVRYDRESLRDVRRRVGLVFQHSDSQLFAPTVYQDVAFGPLNLGLPAEKVRERVSEALRAVGLSGYEGRVPHQLSEGEKKRAAIAGVLAMDPEIMILDEPTASLDPAGAAELIELLDELHTGGVTLVISTHDMELAMRWAEEVILIDRGEVIHQGAPAAILEQPGLMKRAHLVVPPLVELGLELRRRGILKAGCSLTDVPALVQAIEGSLRPSLASSPGTIFLTDASNGIDPEIAPLLGSGTITYTGAMGSIAKKEATAAGIPVHFTHGVVDKCLLRALMGENSLILISGGMTTRVRERVAEFSRDYQVQLGLKMIGPKEGESA